jgi:hypothetical protein
MWVGETDAHGRYLTDIKQWRVASAKCNLWAVKSGDQDEKALDIFFQNQPNSKTFKSH